MTAPRHPATPRAPSGLAVHLAVVVALAMLVPATHAAPQPDEAPDDFRNGQDNAFGAVAMVPYLQAKGGQAVPVEARLWLRDLETVRRANDLLFAFNLKGDGATVALDSLSTTGGTVLVPTQTATVDDGRQQQAHFAPADILAVAGDGSQPLELVLRGRVDPTANGQLHLGAMVIAFDAGWATLSTSDGPAQVYGFTMVMSTGVGGGVMPFQGQGNTWWVVPIAVLTALFVLAGAGAVSALHGAPPLAPLPPPVRSVPAHSGPSPAVRPPPARPSAQPNVPGRPAVAAKAAAIPVFGSPASAPAPQRRPEPVRGPIQGPLPPPIVKQKPVAAPLPPPAPAPAQAPAAVATVTASVAARAAPTPTMQTRRPSKPRAAAARTAPSQARAKAPSRALRESRSGKS